MSYYQHHVFFCCNQREGVDRPCCQEHDADAVRDYAKKKIKAEGLSGQGKVRINKAGCLDRCELGPVLVVFDSVMKVARLAMAGTRTLAEIFLPRISRHLIDGERAEAQRGLWRVTLLCAAATAIPAGAVLFFSPLVFGLLLGPNNVVPPEAAPAAALIIMVSGFYQPATLFLSYLDARRLVLGVAIFASAGAAVAAAIMLIGRFEAAGLLWIYAGFFAAVSGFALLQSRRIEPWEVAREA